MKSLIVGLVIVLISIWVGSYFQHFLDIDDWSNFPIFVTCCAVFIIGFVICVTNPFD